jgi:hypothetical protein
MQRFLVGLIGLLLVVGAGLAARVEADPNKEYHITAEAGGYFICAASFRGPEAPALARELTLVIRRDYQLPAHVYDRGGKEREEQRQKVMALLKTCPEGHFRGVRIEEQFAVLVGGYKDRESARKALDDFKKLPLPPEKFCDTTTIGEPATQNGQQGMMFKVVRISPFANAFVVPNPLLPPEQPDRLKADDFLKKLNAGESLSLLNNKKQWTLMVKSYQGLAAIQTNSTGNKFLDMLTGRSSADHLGAAAMNAHALAQLLRDMKFNGQPVSLESYVLHDRYRSIVTVGSYDSQDDPKMKRDMQMLSKLSLQAMNDPKADAQLRSNVQFLSQPIPIPVPKP